MSTSDQRKDLPPVTSSNFLEKVREALSTYLGNRGDSLDQGLTRRDLLDAGLIGSTITNKVNTGIGGLVIPGSLGLTTTVDAEPDLTPPPTPTGFSATAGISLVNVQCDIATYTMGHGHAKSILYGAKRANGGALPVFANAAPLADFSGNVFGYPTDPATTWHLWLKWVTVDNVPSNIPAGGTNGVVVTTGEDVALLLTALAGKVTTSQLFSTLNTRIDLIDVGPAALTAKVADLATTYANTASSAASAAAAVISAATAAQAKIDAVSSAATATQAKADAITAQGGAANSATTAGTKATESSTSASNAAGSASTASTHASTASTAATNAGNSSSAAATSETNAATYATNSETSSAVSTAAKIAAQSSQSAALGSANAASGSASTATTKASDASTSAGAASQSATTASTKAGEASVSAGNAATSESNAAGSASTATTQAGLATSAENAAGVSATAASVSAGNAATSESNAAGSASTATTQAGLATSAKNAAGDSATAASVSAGNAAISESNAAGSASTATTQAGLATSAKNAAGDSATAAFGSASTATTKASDAGASASAAAGSASTASTKAGDALTYSTNAASSESNAAASATTATTQAGLATNAKNAAGISAAASLVSQGAASTSESNAAGSATSAANTFTYLRSYSNIGAMTFRVAAAPTKRGVDPETLADIALRVGDGWVDTDDGNKPYNWSGTAWVTATDTTTQAAFNAWVLATYNVDISGLTDSKIESYFTGTDPSTTWSGTSASHTGDLWYNSTAKLLKRWSASAWQTVEDKAAIDAAAAAYAAQGTADSKITTFVKNGAPTSGNPAALTTGDLCIDTSAAGKNQMYRWNGTSWVDVRDSTIAAVDARVTEVNTTRIGYAKVTATNSPFDNGGTITNKTEMDAYNATHGNTLTWVVGLPLAQAIKQLTISVNGTTGTIEDRMTAVAETTNSMYLEKAVRIGSGGSVVGYGLSGHVSGGEPVVTDSMFIANVDTFAVTIPISSVTVWAANTTYTRYSLVKANSTGSSYPTEYLQCAIAGTSGSSSAALFGHVFGTESTDGTAKWVTVSRVPFSVAKATTTVDGITVPMGAFMDGAYIRDATITNAAIHSLAADKITAGDVTVSLNLTAANTITGSIKSNSTGVYPGSSLAQPIWEISGTGLATFNNAIVRGAIYASSGTFTGTVSATTINGSTINGTFIDLITTGGSWLRSNGKGWNDSANGVVIAQGTDGSNGVDMKAGTSRLWLSSWGDCGFQMGATPAISATTMTGSGLKVTYDGTFCVGNSTKNFTWTPSAGLTINGDVVVTGNLVSNAVTVPVGSTGYGSIPSATITLPYAGKIMVMVSVNALAYDGSEASLSVTATCGASSGPTLGISLGFAYSGALTAVGYFAVAAGIYTVGGTTSVTIGNRTITDTSLFAVGYMR